MPNKLVCINLGLTALSALTAPQVTGDSRDFLVDEPPLVNDIDCDPLYPQDPLTGEPLFKIEDLIEIKDEICADPVEKNPG